MKICEICGYKNWEPGDKCDNCHNKFKQSAQCNPMVGNRGVVVDENGNKQWSQSIGPLNPSRGYY